jgi:hypothetical protein
MLRKDWIGASRACGLLKQPDNQKLASFRERKHGVKRLRLDYF